MHQAPVKHQLGKRADGDRTGLLEFENVYGTVTIDCNQVDGAFALGTEQLPAPIFFGDMAF